eukprot:TRINITY_DN275_c0_g5_i1.p1 TRINITY_DN275_c0_g5~~TRINITY_DN275_c0_g5_i1.p1  ORF type:complete len:1480 (+),score=360.75 TRINITY_DN275_c0_g5_i1:72-4511(+)
MPFLKKYGKAIFLFLVIVVLSLISFAFSNASMAYSALTLSFGGICIIVIMRGFKNFRSIVLCFGMSALIFAIIDVQGEGTDLSSNSTDPMVYVGECLRTPEDLSPCPNPDFDFVALQPGYNWEETKDFVIGLDMLIPHIEKYEETLAKSYGLEQDPECVPQITAIVCNGAYEKCGTKCESPSAGCSTMTCQQFQQKCPMLIQILDYFKSNDEFRQVFESIFTEEKTRQRLYSLMNGIVVCEDRYYGDTPACQTTTGPWVKPGELYFQTVDNPMCDDAEAFDKRVRDYETGDSDDTIDVMHLVGHQGAFACVCALLGLLVYVFRTLPASADEEEDEGFLDSVFGICQALMFKGTVLSLLIIFSMIICFVFALKQEDDGHLVSAMPFYVIAVSGSGFLVMLLGERARFMEKLLKPIEVPITRNSSKFIYGFRIVKRRAKKFLASIGLNGRHFFPKMAMLLILDLSLQTYALGQLATTKSGIDVVIFALALALNIVGTPCILCLNDPLHARDFALLFDLVLDTFYCGFSFVARYDMKDQGFLELLSFAFPCFMLIHVSLTLGKEVVKVNSLNDEKFHKRLPAVVGQRMVYQMQSNRNRKVRRRRIYSATQDGLSGTGHPSRVSHESSTGGGNGSASPSSNTRNFQNSILNRTASNSIGVSRASSTIKSANSVFPASNIASNIGTVGTFLTPIGDNSNKNKKHHNPLGKIGIKDSGNDETLFDDPRDNNNNNINSVGQLASYTSLSSVGVDVSRDNNDVVINSNTTSPASPKKRPLSSGFQNPFTNNNDKVGTSTNLASSTGSIQSNIMLPPAILDNVKVNNNNNNDKQLKRHFNTASTINNISAMLKSSDGSMYKQGPSSSNNSHLIPSTINTSQVKRGQVVPVGVPEGLPTEPVSGRTLPLGALHLSNRRNSITNRAWLGHTRNRTLRWSTVFFNLLLGVTLALSTIYRFVSQNKECSDEIGSNIWVECSPKVIFPDGFFQSSGCGYNKIESIDLSDKQMTVLDSSIMLLSELNSIDLSNNWLREYPVVLRGLPLTSVNLADNFIDTIPHDLPSIITELNIERNHVEQFLDWSNLGLTKLPDFLYLLTSLRGLSIAGNDIDTFHSKFRQMELLETLDISGNSRLGAVPVEITSLTKLAKLYASNINLDEVPDMLQELDVLKELDLRNNTFAKIPSWLALRMFDETSPGTLLVDGNPIIELNWKAAGLAKIDPIFTQTPDVTNFDVGFNFLSSVPDSIFSMKKLVTINMGVNVILEIPNGLGELTDLHYLNLKYNKLSKFPEGIGNCTELTYLNIAGNSNIMEIPDDVTKLPKLKELDVGDLRFGDGLVLPVDFWKIPIDVLVLDDRQTVVMDNPGIVNLPNLISLSVGNSPSVVISDAAWAKINTLRVFGASKNEWTSLPDFLTFPELRWLDITYNKMETIPDSVVNAPNLRCIYMVGNSLPASEITRFLEAQPDMTCKFDMFNAECYHKNAACISQTEFE